MFKSFFQPDKLVLKVPLFGGDKAAYKFLTSKEGQEMIKAKFGQEAPSVTKEAIASLSKAGETPKQFPPKKDQFMIQPAWATALKSGSFYNNGNVGQAPSLPQGGGCDPCGCDPIPEEWGTMKKVLARSAVAFCGHLVKPKFEPVYATEENALVSSFMLASGFANVDALTDEGVSTGVPLVLTIAPVLEQAVLGIELTYSVVADGALPNVSVLWEADYHQANGSFSLTTVTRPKKKGEQIRVIVYPYTIHAQTKMGYAAVKASADSPLSVTLSGLPAGSSAELSTIQTDDPALQHLIVGGTY